MQTLQRKFLCTLRAGNPSSHVEGIVDANVDTTCAPHTAGERGAEGGGQALLSVCVDSRDVAGRTHDLEHVLVGVGRRGAEGVT